MGNILKQTYASSKEPEILTVISKKKTVKPFLKYVI